MTKQAAAVLALGIAGAIITCAFIYAFIELRGPLWIIASLVTACYTLSTLAKLAISRTPEPVASAKEDLSRLS